MIDKRDFTQETLEKIRTGEKPKTFIKRRRLSKIILIIDIIVIVIILAIINQRGHESIYHTTSLILDEMEYRFSLIREEKSSNYVLSVTIKSNSNVEKSYYYNNSIADINIQHAEAKIFNLSIGDNISSVKLLPGELKTFVKGIDISYFRRYAEENPEHITPPQKTLISLEKRHVPLQAVITLNTKERVSTKLNFKYRVE
ncbi:MAG: hypothetical protein SVZ03_01930 [Spirochaetota bacterium]|nr:hypothetical protein [Spirochaetota bacterium]